LSLNLINPGGEDQKKEENKRLVKKKIILDRKHSLHRKMHLVHVTEYRKEKSLGADPEESSPEAEYITQVTKGNLHFHFHS